MTFRELETRWKTEHVDSVPVTLITETGKVLTNMDRFRHEAPIGDFAKAYIDHLMISRWRRRYDWDLVEEAMRKKMNQAVFQWH
jgi:hypothetical protein